MTTREGEGCDTFSFCGYEWDVTAGLELAAGVPVVPLEVSSALQLLPFIYVDREYAAGVDLAEPVLAVPFREAGSLLVIDGWHRLWRAHANGVAQVPCRVLTEEQERRVRLRGAPVGRGGR